MLSFSAGFNSMPNFAVGAPSKPNVEAVLGVVPVVLVPADQHVGKAGLADSHRTHDHDARARIPGALLAGRDAIHQCNAVN